MVVTGAPRKRLVRKGTWVRIPPSPPTFILTSLRVDQPPAEIVPNSPPHQFKFNVVNASAAFELELFAQRGAEQRRPLLVVSSPGRVESPQPSFDHVDWKSNTD